MTKRICSCGSPCFIAVAGLELRCLNCGAEIPPKSCEVEMERCKPDRLDEIRERAENLKQLPLRYMSIGEKYYLADIPFLLDEITRLRTELDAAVKDISRKCVTCGKRRGWETCKEASFISDGEECLNWEWRGTEAQGK